MLTRRSNSPLAAIWAVGLTLFAAVSAATPPATTRPTDLARGRPATSSSVEDDDHDAARANDGRADTSWRADDEPEGGPDWWQVDLGQPCDVDACRITWPYDGMCYRCRVEGSADRARWFTLSDQTRSAVRSRTQRLACNGGRGVRYVRVTITGFDDGCGAGISEVEVFGSAQRH